MAAAVPWVTARARQVALATLFEAPSGSRVLRGESERSATWYRITMSPVHVALGRDGLSAGQACRRRFLPADPAIYRQKGIYGAPGGLLHALHPYPSDGARFFAVSRRQRGLAGWPSRSRIHRALSYRLGERADRPPLRLDSSPTGNTGARSASTSSCMDSPTSPSSGFGCPPPDCIPWRPISPLSASCEPCPRLCHMRRANGGCAGVRLPRRNVLVSGQRSIFEGVDFGPEGSRRGMVDAYARRDCGRRGVLP